MPPRLLSLRARILPLAALAAGLQLFGCSSKGPQDKNLGTDAGLGFVPPDVPIRTDTPPGTDAVTDRAEVMIDSAAPDSSAAESGPAAAPDGALPSDAAVDAGDEGEGV
jgi:hypothetical protein